MPTCPNCEYSGTLTEFAYSDIERHEVDLRGAEGFVCPSCDVLLGGPGFA